MPRIIKQAQAEQDLLDIWLYTFSEWGEKQADVYLDNLSEALALLADQPLICRERLEFTPPVRVHRHAHHLPGHHLRLFSGRQITPDTPLIFPILYSCQNVVFKLLMRHV